MTESSSEKTKEKKKILAINGSAASNSSNLKLLQTIEVLTKEELDLTIFDDLKLLPHFDPDLSVTNTPQQIINFRNLIQNADGIIICTPEYIFSIPSGLKNAIEWCIATTVLENKPTGLIIASASGQKALEELQLIMKTAMAKFTDATTLLIQGIKGKLDDNGHLTDDQTQKRLKDFITAFINLD